MTHPTLYLVPTIAPADLWAEGVMVIDVTRPDVLGLLDSTFREDDGEHAGEIGFILVGGNTEWSSTVYEVNAAIALAQFFTVWGATPDGEVVVCSEDRIRRLLNWTSNVDWPKALESLVQKMIQNARIAERNRRRAEPEPEGPLKPEAGLLAYALREIGDLYVNGHKIAVEPR